MSATVSIEIDSSVAMVVVDSPPVNALSNATIDALTGAAQQIESDQSVRAVVLASAGDRVFLSGADLNEFAPAMGELAWITDHTSRTRRMLAAWEGLRQPVTAAVSGSAIGGGLEVALVCDLIVADPEARFGQPEVRLGLIPGAGGTQRLPRRIGVGRANELLLLGGTIDAEEAHRVGLVNRVAEPGRAREEADALAARLAGLPAVAVAAIKRSVGGVAREELERGLDLERDLFIAAFSSSDASEGVRAFLEKRPANFTHH